MIKMELFLFTFKSWLGFLQRSGRIKSQINKHTRRSVCLKMSKILLAKSDFFTQCTSDSDQVVGLSLKSDPDCQDVHDAPPLRLECSVLNTVFFPVHFFHQDLKCCNFNCAWDTCKRDEHIAPGKLVVFTTVYRTLLTWFWIHMHLFHELFLYF